MEEKKITYAQEAIKKIIFEKTELREMFQDHSYSENSIQIAYGDYCHSDYSDYCPIN